MNVDLHPTTCNICGGEVIFTSNSKIYGKEYGSGKMYFCTVCGAYVGTHEPRPKEAYGVLADRYMREMKKRCHALLEPLWQCGKNGKERHLLRNKAYKDLATALDIPVAECHFGYFDKELLERAFGILSS